MAELVSVTAVQPLTYRGQPYRPGESFDCKPVEALSLTYQKKATFTKPIGRYRTADLVPETTEAPATRPKRKYRRRDLQAEE